MSEKAQPRTTTLSVDQEIRLACLKLAHSHGLEVRHILDKAKQYEGFVTGTTSQPE